MTPKTLPLFTQALHAGQDYVRTSVRARDAQYRFLAIAYLAYREGQAKPKTYQSVVSARLGREPTLPEIKRPFLLLLHALIGREDDNPPDALPQFSKLTSALEEIDRAFKDTGPSIEDLFEFIRDSGGVGGLYDLSRIGHSEDGSEPSDNIRSITDLNPNDIALPQFGLCITKVGRGYRLRMIDRSPGEYKVRLRIGRGGFIEAILDGEEMDRYAA